MDRDPTPGDPEQIEQLARFYQDIGDDAETGVRVLGRGGTLSNARGDSMEKLRDMLKSLPGKLQRTVDSFDAAAQAYRTYARSLSEQQARIDTAMDQATAVADVARRTTTPLPATATPDEIVDARTQADEIAGARAQLSAAQRLAEDARRLREVASAQCNRALDEAASKAIKPPPRRRLLQRIGDFFRNNPIFQLIIDIVIAVVGVVFPVVGLILAAVQLVVTVAVQSANGNFELGTLLVGLVSLVPAGKLLGPFTRGLESVAPGLVATARTGAKAFGEIGTNNTVISGALKFGGRAGDVGRQTVVDFGKGVVEGVATTGLNQLGNKNADGFNAASILGGAAAGSVAGNAFDGIRKGVSRGPEFDLPSGTGSRTDGGSVDAAPAAGPSRVDAPAAADAPVTPTPSATAPDVTNAPAAGAPTTGGPATGPDTGTGQAAVDPRPGPADPTGATDNGAAAAPVPEASAPAAPAPPAVLAPEASAPAGSAPAVSAPAGPVGSAPDGAGSLIPPAADGPPLPASLTPPPGGIGQNSAGASPAGRAIPNEVTPAPVESPATPAPPTDTSPPPTDAGTPPVPAVGVGSPASVPTTAPPAPGSGAKSDPDDPRPPSSPEPDQQPAAAPETQVPDPEDPDDLAERAADTAKESVSKLASFGASTAIENNQDDDNSFTKTFPTE